MSGTLTSTRLADLIAMATQYIDMETGQWFEKRDFSAESPFLMDGSGTPVLQFHVPIISVTSIMVDGELVDPDRYVVYSRIPYDRGNPRIVLKSWHQCHGSVSHHIFGHAGPRWHRGYQNVSIVCSLGHVDQDGNNYKTPVVIKRVAMRLVTRELEQMYEADSSGIEERKRSRVISETTDGHSYSLSALAVTGGLTGDPDVDGPLSRMHAPIYCRAK